ALCAAFPHLRAEDHEVVTRLRNTENGLVLIDVMKPNQAIIKAALQYTHSTALGHQAVTIPSLEMALALKFAAMISLNRAEIDRQQDALDFKRIVHANPTIDLEKAADLGKLVYNGGGEEMLRHIERAR